jgi:DNA-binding SARP family transcriptional activator
MVAVHRRLSAKAVVPAHVGLVRERLLGLAQSRLGLVLAPAGYGKTRLLAQVADSHGGAVCWYRADSADREPTLLMAKLGNVLLRSLEVTAPANSWNHLLDAVQGASQVLLLVVDDFHELEGSESEQCLADLIESAPDCLQILIAGRRWPALDIRQLEMSGECSLVDAADLQFRSWEVERLFREVYAEPLRPEDAAALTRRTGGWAAGLAMFRLLTSGRSPAERHQAVCELGGCSRLVRTYLVREVLEELQPEIREFLRRTCALGVLTARSCDALLQRSDSQQVLDDLERRQLFLSTEDGVRYRYHQVLQDHLELELLEQFGTAAARDLYERAGTWLENAGEVGGAFRAYVRAEQWAAVQRLLQVRGSDVVAKPLGPVAERIPVTLSGEDPWLVLAEARRLARHGTLERAVAAYRKAEALTADQDVAALCRKERRHAALWLLGGDGPADGEWPGIVRAAMRKSPGRAAHVAAARSGPEALLAAGLAELLAGSLDRADAILRNAAHDSEAGPDLVRIAAYARAVMALLTGRKPSDLPELEAVVLDAEVADRPWWARLGCALLEASSDCSAALDQMRAQADAEEDLWGSGIIRLLRGIITHEADVLEEAGAVFGRLDAPVVRLWAHCLVAAAAGERKPHLMREAWTTAKALDAPEVMASAQRWADQPARRTGRLPRQRPAQLRVLGGFELTTGGVIVDQFAVRPRARKVLHVLAMQVGRAVHRDMLAQAVWPDTGPDAARRSVHVAISSLRHLLEPDSQRGQSLLLPRLGDAYTLALPEGSRCDLLEFEAGLVAARTARLSGDGQAERSSLRRALDHYGGDLMPEDGSAEWVVAERERLRVAAASASEQLARADSAAGDVLAALEHARRALSFDTYRDSTWRLLIQLHERAGDMSAAHAVRQKYERMLAELDAAAAPLPAQPR